MREWTEKHIRELIKDEAKKLKPSGVDDIAGINIERNVGDFLAGGGFNYLDERYCLRNLRASNEVITNLDYRNPNMVYKTYYYDLGPISNYGLPTILEENILTGEKTPVVLENAPYVAFLPFALGEVCDKPLYEGQEPKTRPSKIDTYPFYALENMFVYQNGLKFPLRPFDYYVKDVPIKLFLIDWILMSREDWESSYQTLIQEYGFSYWGDYVFGEDMRIYFTLAYNKS